MKLLPFNFLLCFAMAIPFANCSTCYVHADMVTINNSSFETDILTDGSFLFSIAGWTTSGDSGVFNPSTASYAGGLAPDGDNVAFSSEGSPYISQILTATLQADTQYDLQIDIGNRLDETFPGYEVELLAGGLVLAADLNLLAVTNGQFETSMVSYLSSSTDSMLGQQLEIRFRSLGRQANFDNVRISANSVPEPSGAAVILLSVAGLFATRRRRNLES